METWATVLVALIVALSTLGATFLQNWHSNKRFGRELEKAKEEQKRQRRWEVRGEPLLKLRSELARMATELNKVLSAAHEIQNSNDSARQQAEENLQKALEDWKTHMRSGDLFQTMFTQYDTELFQKIIEINNDYEASYNTVMHAEDMIASVSQEVSAFSGKIWPKVVEVQELINRRLEEL